MKLFIKISNIGEIDTNALTLIGASTKRDDNTKIGYFGSGLKYSLAVLIRNKIDFSIFSGLKKIKITTEKINFRDKEFNIIKINDKKTSLTTEMGIDWKNWFAIREIYCNALDEPGFELSIVPECLPEEGKTNFYIEMTNDLREVLDNWNQYFSNKRSDILHTEDGTKYFYGHTNNFIIYRKGIRCFHETRKSLFHYDLDWIKINESRVVDSFWDVSYYLPKHLASTATVKMIQMFIDEYRGTVEEKFSWEYVSYFSNNWLIAINNRSIIVEEFSGNYTEFLDKSIILPGKIVKVLKNYFKNKITIIGDGDMIDDSTIIFEPTEKQKMFIDESLRFLKNGGFSINIPIKIATFKNEKIMGTVKNSTILLSPLVFNYGKRQVTTVILEEMSHYETGFNDKTRGFQDYLFNTIISILEDKLNQYL